MVDHRGGMRNAAITTKASSTKGMSSIVVTPPGGAENTQLVMASMANAISIISTAGPAGAECWRARQRTAQPMTIGAMDRDPSQLPAHQICNSRTYSGVPSVRVVAYAPTSALAAAPTATEAMNNSTLRI